MPTNGGSRLSQPPILNDFVGHSGRKAKFHAMHSIGSVSYLNATPLVDGLDCDPSVRIEFDVPSMLLDGLLDRSTDIALVPVIDYQTAPQELCIVPSGGIGSDGETLTVRVFSRTPISEIRRVAVDGDSRTSVALLQVIFHDVYGTRPELSPLVRTPSPADLPHDIDAVLLIGDKVVSSAPPLPIQLDLGEAWKHLTGMPFVFATWMARSGTDLGDLPRKLARRREMNQRRVAEIAAFHAADAGWPHDLAVHYLGTLLSYELGQRELKAIALFWERCHDLGIIPGLRPLVLHDRGDARDR